MNDRWELLSSRVHIPLGAAKVTYRFQNLRQSGSTDDSYLDHAFVYVAPNTQTTDMGAYGNTTASVLAVTDQSIHLQSPDLYVNWTLNQPHPILWSTLGNAGSGPVKIDLYQDVGGVPTFLMTIASSAADNGSFSWIPANSGLSANTTGLRIQVSMVGTPAILDRSTEAFAIVPSNATAFYINDGSTTNDQYTTVAGNNRATGLSPSSPLPMLTTLMREYTIGSGSTIYADNGLYNQFQAAVFSSIPALGTGAGATLQGPTNANAGAAFLALGYADDGVIDVNDANFVTIKNVGLDYGLYGLWSLGGSQNLTLSNVSAFQAAQDGIRIESDSSASSLAHISSTGNGQDGIFIGGASATLSNIDASSNSGDGIYINGNFTSLTNSTADLNGADGYDFPNAGAAVITNDEAHNNLLGIYVNNPTQNTTTMVGNTNLAAGQGNIFHNNLSKGMEVGIGVTVAGNTVFGQSSSGGIGIQIDNACTVTNNVVWGNVIGINDSNNANPVSYNRVFDNSTAGIALSGGSSTLGDVIYSNGVGLLITNSFTGATPVAANDLIYANASAGVSINESNNLQFLNNTIYQITSDAVLIGVRSNNISLRNNILWSKGGYDIEVASTSENGFSADYNLFYTTNTGKVGFWDGVARSTLALWRAATATDSNSLYVQPLFVNVSPNDLSVGYSLGVDNGATDDFHDQSTGGSFHGGSLAPVISSTTGLPVALTSSVTADASTSPAVDRGDPASSFANEPSPNGGFINIGAYGNTAQASKSATSYVVMINPNGGESLIAGKNYAIKWRSQDNASTVNIDLLQGSSPQIATVVSNIATAAPNSGQFIWSIPSNTTAATNYYVRVKRNDTSASANQRSKVFDHRDRSRVLHQRLDCSGCARHHLSPGQRQQRRLVADVADGDFAGDAASVRSGSGRYDLCGQWNLHADEQRRDHR